MPRIIISFLLMAVVSTVTLSQDKALFRFPDVSKEHIVFSFENDIWLVDKDGGQAYRLSVPVGAEIFAKFSPDGQTLAYSAEYDGNMDVYTIPIGGGVPTRLTYHGMTDFVIDWHPDGDKVLFASSRHSGKQRWSQFYTVPTKGGLPTKLPLEHAQFGTYNEDASKIAFTQKSRLFRTWKRYRGGSNADLHLFDFNTGNSDRLTNTSANDELPMIRGNKVYFLSDQGAENRMNLWVHDLSTSSNTQLTAYTDDDIHFPSMGPDEIVYLVNGEMHLLSLSDHSDKQVNIKLTGDFGGLKPKWETVDKYVQHASISPSGGRAVVESRGEIFSVPAKEGIVKNLTQSSGSAQRFPAWSPDGKSVAWWSDATGEYQLVIYNAVKGTSKTLTSFEDGYRYNIFWSPNNRYVAFIDEDMVISMIDVQSGSTTRIDQANSRFHGGLEWFKARWSKDSKWVAYEKLAKGDANMSIHLYSVEEGKVHKVTSGFYSDYNPVFDPKGEYLYYLSSRDFNPVYSDFDNTWVYPNSTKIMAVGLKNSLGSPLEFKNDTVAITEDKKKEEAEKSKDKKGKKGKKGKKKDKDSDDGNGDDSDEKEETITIDLNDFEARSLAMPIKTGNYWSLDVVEDKLVYMVGPPRGDRNTKRRLAYYDLKEKEEKTIVEDVFNYVLSHDKKKALIYAPMRKMYIIKVSADQKLKDALSLSKMRMKINPKEEWRQLFVDAWRIERDFFYDEKMHGVDWQGVRAKYEPMIEQAASRSDVNFILGEMIGELNASHTYRGGGDHERVKRIGIGYLGIDWANENGQWTVGRIVRGAAWDTEVRSPLDDAGLGIEEGDYILAINGVELGQFSNPHEGLANLASTLVEITYAKKQSPDKRETCLVETLGNETRLRNLEWIENNRRFVEKASNGRVGYIYVPSTGWDGQKELTRMFYAQFKKDALIIDERFNNGGQIPDRFVELLERKPLSYYHTRNGQDWQWPPVAHFGPKVMMINGWSGSGGDAFPYYFKERGLGPLIGTRTWGGLIGISGAPGLIDGGGVTAPTFRMYDLDGEWFPEGHGVEPDIEVLEDPAALARGEDPQLQRAVDEALMLLEKEGFQKPKVPAKENR